MVYGRRLGFLRPFPDQPRGPKFWNTHYGEDLSSGSYDDVRRKDFMYLREAGLAIPSAANPDANTNNPTRRWAIAEAAGRLTREFGTRRWSRAVDRFIAEQGTLAERVNRYRDLKKPGVIITLSNGRPLSLAPGPHNDLQRQVVEGFLPRFAPDSEVLYVGDTSKKILHRDVQKLNALGFFDLEHGRLPDIVAHDSIRNWILLIEAVHSSQSDGAASPSGTRTPYGRLHPPSGVRERVRHEGIFPRVDHGDCVGD